MNPSPAVQNNLTENIHFIAADWFEPVSRHARLFDMIISNPPYIKSGQLNQLQPEIYTYEPLLALDGAADGLSCLQHIIQNAHLFLKPAGILLLEIGHEGLDTVVDALHQLLCVLHRGIGIAENPRNFR